MPILFPHAHIHCLGIGGFGINPIARVLHQMGYFVSGCDVTESPLVPPLRKAGIRIEIGHSSAHIESFQPDLLLISSAVTSDNPEVVAAKENNIPIYKRSDILGALMEGRTGIAVAGTHGKTTTTAMIAHVLSECEIDPTFIIGGVSQNLGVNARAGKGKAFVIEADEYDRMFMGLKPRIIVLTSLEMDHPDMFADLDAVRSLFAEFVDLLPEDGLLIGCNDDREVFDLVKKRLDKKRPAMTYGLGSATWYATNLKPSADGGTDFLVARAKVADRISPKDMRKQVSLRMPGSHNVQNALATLAVAMELGVKEEQAIAALAGFKGTERRFEIKGETNGVTVVDDYAHHPTAIRATLQAARSRYGTRPIWAVWQPHTYRRTKALLSEFAACFGEAQHVIITDVYQSRDAETFGVSVDDVLARMTHVDVRHIGTLSGVVDYLTGHVKSGDVVITMSAGDATKIGDDLLKKLGSKAAGKKT
ncbi:MAG: UDP-N-acetylmuramate--L-alanine ligase [Anaerolineae bacterium]|nr:UDP-N-acetylmuramate--L-alanine ligase [Anaerolineae bacterium]